MSPILESTEGLGDVPTTAAITPVGVNRIRRESPAEKVQEALDIIVEENFNGAGADEEIVYLSGPMSDYDHFNFPAFEAATKDLRGRGIAVLSPHELDDPKELAGLDPGHVPEERWIKFMSRDIALLCDARVKGVVVLPDWEKSKGATFEVDVARRLGKWVRAYPDLEDVPVKRSLLAEADDLIHGDRGRDYGHPIIDFTKQAKMMSQATGLRNPDGSEIRPDQIPLLMICVKLSRLEQTPDHLDSMKDIAGYAGTWEMVLEAQGRL